MPITWRFGSAEAAAGYDAMIKRLALEEVAWERQAGHVLSVSDADAIVVRHFDDFLRNLKDCLLRGQIRDGEFARNVCPLSPDDHGAPRWRSDFKDHVVYWSWWMRENWGVLLEIDRP